MDYLFYICNIVKVFEYERINKKKDKLKVGICSIKYFV